MNASKALLTIIALLVHLLSFSQGEWNNWYFGKRAGVTFNSGSPVPLTDGANYIGSNCGVISDSLGNLLFYTDGISVFKKDHSRMLNGYDLIRNDLSQGPLILPVPNNKNIYYIITVYNPVENLTLIPDFGLHYSIVDMTLDNGKRGW